MEESDGQFFVDVNTRMRELEERQMILKDRTMLIGKGVVEVKEKTSTEMRELRKMIYSLQQENNALKQTVQLMSEKLNNTCKKEELQMLRRQFELIRDGKE